MSIKINTFNYLKVSRVIDTNIYFHADQFGEIILDADSKPDQEDLQKIKPGRSFIVYVYNDSNNKITASLQIEQYLDKTPVSYTDKDEVDIIIYKRTDLGFKAIINNLHIGVIYKNEVFTSLHIGQKTNAYIKKIREDNRIDLIIHKPGYTKVDKLSEKIINLLKENNGILEVSDKSTPEKIYDMFGDSKSTFKNAIGALYKKRKIELHKDCIKLIK